MKQLLLIFLALLLTSTSKGQLTVFENGSVNVGSNAKSSLAIFSVGNPDSCLTKYDRVNFSSINRVLPNCKNIAIDGQALSAYSIGNGLSIGVRGIAGNCNSGYNYGVFGTLYGTNKGASIYGGVGSFATPYIDGRYAGYFNGDVIVTGGLQAKLSNIFDTKDVGLYDMEISDALGKINLLIPRLNVYNTPVVSGMDEPTLGSNNGGINNQTIESAGDNFMQTIKKYAYGFNINEVERDFPLIVYTDDNGNKKIDYTQIIPVLVKSIKELSEEVQMLKEQINESNVSQVAQGSSKVAANIENNEILKDCKLFQNSPNPFKGNTTIKFELSNNAVNASINIYNNTGKLIKVIPVNNNMTEVSFQNVGLSNGIYYYTLIVNGLSIDTKRMIIAE